MKNVFGILIITLLLFASCGLKLKPFDADDGNGRIEIARYDRLQSRYLTTGDFSALQSMNTDFPQETRTLIEKVLQIGQVIDPDISTNFLRFYQDSTLQVLISDAEAEYADMDDISDQLNTVFDRLRKWVPEIPTPRVYAQIGALDQSVIVGDRSIGICLDKYLGERYPLYEKYYLYQQRVTMTRAYIVPDCVVFYLLSLYSMSDYDRRPQIEKDLHMGKIMWVANKAMGKRFFRNKYVSTVDRYMRKHPKQTMLGLLESDDYSAMRP